MKFWCAFLFVSFVIVSNLARLNPLKVDASAVTTQSFVRRDRTVIMSLGTPQAVPIGGTLTAVYNPPNCTQNQTL